MNYTIRYKNHLVAEVKDLHTTTLLRAIVPKLRKSYMGVPFVERKGSETYIVVPPCHGFDGMIYAVEAVPAQQYVTWHDDRELIQS